MERERKKSSRVARPNEVPGMEGLVGCVGGEFVGGPWLGGGGPGLGRARR